MRSLLPRFIVDSYGRGESSGGFVAAAMFLDVSGFMDLTERLMREGKEGAEVLSGIINSVFDPVIGIVRRNGGFIASFAGDACTALFRDLPVDYAFRAAFAVQESMDSSGLLRTKFGDFALAVRIGLSYGRVEFGIIDAVVQKTFFFRGPAIDGCAAALARAERSSIVADAAMLSMASAAIDSRSVDGEWLAVMPSPLVLDDACLSGDELASPEIEKEFVPKAVIDLKQRGEFREIVSCFISFSSEGAFEPALARVAESARLYGGYFNKIDFGDKGGVALVLFGAPLGLEKLYKRAADFACGLRAIPNFLFRVGVTTGLAFAGFVGSSGRGEYTALGNVVNLSARIAMGAAWRDIVVGTEFARRIAGCYACDSLGPSRFEGYSQPVETFRIGGKSPLAPELFSGGFVGRAAETAALAGALAPIAAGSFGGLVYVDGPAGIGKSRFLSNFESANRVYRFVRLECDQILRKPFNPFERFFKRHFGQDENASPEENGLVFHRLYRAFVDGIPEGDVRDEAVRTESVLAAAVGLETDGSLYSGLDAKGRYGNTVSAMKNFFKALSLSGPAVVELDDAHWLDDDSAALVRAMARNVDCYPYAIVALCRPGDDGLRYSVPGGEGAEPEARRIELAAFGRADMEALIAERLGAVAPPQETLDFVWDKSGGNPFFGEQLVLYLSENGRLDGGLRIHGGVDSVPSEIGQVIVARIDRLSASMKETVKAASVLGRVFALKVLERLLSVNHIIRSDEELGSYLHDGRREQLWDDFSELHYIFKHALIRDAAYGMQLKESLRSLHNLAGSVIEELYADSLAEHCDELADHFSKAENADKAIAYLELAGDRAKAAYENGKAIDCYDRLLAAIGASDTGKTVAVTAKKCEILELIGSWDAEILALERGIAIAEKAEPPQPALELYILYAESLNNKSEYEKAMAVCGKVRDIALADSDMASFGSATTILGTVHSSMGSYPEAIASFNEANEVFRGLGDGIRAAKAINAIGVVHAALGEYEEAIACYERNRALFESSGNRKDLGAVIGNIGVTRYYQGRYDEALECFERKRAIAAELGDTLAIGSASSNMGSVYWFNKGDYPKALACYEVDRKICEELGDKRGLSITIGNIGLVHLDTGNDAGALEYFEAALGMCEGIGDRPGIAVAEDNLGIVLERLGRPDEAMRQYDAAIALGAELGIKYDLCYFHICKAKLAFELGRFGEAETACAQAMTIAAEVDRGDVSYGAKLLECSLLARTDGTAALDTLEAYAQAAEDPSDKAAARYERYRIGRAETDRTVAITLYTDLFAHTPNVDYKKRLHELAAG